MLSLLIPLLYAYTSVVLVLWVDAVGLSLAVVTAVVLVLFSRRKLKQAKPEEAETSTESSRSSGTLIEVGRPEPKSELPTQPPSSSESGEFTRIFGAPPEVSPERESGEFTRMFGRGAQPELSPEPGSGKFTRVGHMEGYAVVRIFYATDRKTGQFTHAGDFYLNERDADRSLKFGLCDVSIPGAERHKIGRLETPSIWRLEFREDPAKHVTLLGVRPLPHDEFFAAVEAQVTTSRTKAILVFVHGYNVSFEDAARRTGQLAHDLQFDGAPILYSWPSRADPKAYPVDETNVAWSVPQLRKFLWELSRATCASTIHLVAHSMGNRALVAALHEMALQYKSGEGEVQFPLFHHVVLTAPDIDAETFRELAAVFRPTARRVTLYSCLSDKALALSRTFHGYPRAGDCIVIVPNIEVIDASAVDTSLLRHSYFAESRSVVSDIYWLLKEDKSPADRFGMSQMSTDKGIYYVFRP